jgi:hypothetical protein
MGQVLKMWVDMQIFDIEAFVISVVVFFCFVLCVREGNVVHVYVQYSTAVF